MKTALRALVLIVVASGIAGVYFLFGPEHAPAGDASALNNSSAHSVNS